MSRRRARTGARAIAIAASVVLHLILLVLLTRYLVSAATYSETPAVQVVLVSPTAARSPRPPETRRARRPLAAPERPTVAPAEIGKLAPPRAPGVSEPGSLPDGVRQALRGLAGCDSPRLTREDRERCETRRWAADGGADPKLNLDLHGRYAESTEPFLSRRPTKGCRVRATGDVSPGGDDGNVRAGVTCVVPF